MFPGAVADRDAAEFVVVGAPLDVSTTFQPGTRFGPDRVRTFARTFDDFDARTGRHFSDLAVHDHGDVRAWDDAAALLLGGEHTVTVAGVRATDPDVFVCLDAHLDLRAEYDGNPLSHATVTRHVLETADEAIILGARTGSEDEWDRASESDVTVVSPEDVDAWTPGFDAEA